jgi:hypothetical protein
LGDSGGVWRTAGSGQKKPLTAESADVAQSSLRRITTSDQLRTGTAAGGVSKKQVLRASSDRCAILQSAQNDNLK